jgi:hypothetical protein
MTKPMMWIAYDPLIHDHLKNREQFNGDEPAWGESMDDHLAKQGVDVPLVGDDIQLRMGRVVVISRCLEQPDYDENDHRVSSWYWWCLIVKRYGR